MPAFLKQLETEDNIKVLALHDLPRAKNSHELVVVLFLFSQLN